MRWKYKKEIEYSMLLLPLSLFINDKCIFVVNGRDSLCSRSFLICNDHFYEFLPYQVFFYIKWLTFDIIPLLYFWKMQNFKDVFVDFSPVTVACCNWGLTVSWWAEARPECILLKQRHLKIFKWFLLLWLNTQIFGNWGKHSQLDLFLLL